MAFRPEGDRAAAVVPVAAAAVAVAVSLDVALDGPLVSLDPRVSVWVLSTGLPATSWGPPSLPGRLAEAATHLGAPEVAAYVAVALLLICRNRRTLRPLVRFALATVLLVATVQLMKIGFGRLPPLSLGSDGEGRSYPSGHAATSTVYWGLLARTVAEARYGRRARGSARTLAIVAPLLTMAGMLLLDYHWLSDLIGGAALGAALLGVLRLVERLALTHWADGPGASGTGGDPRIAWGDVASEAGHPAGSGEGRRNGFREPGGAGGGARRRSAGGGGGRPGRNLAGGDLAGNREAGG